MGSSDSPPGPATKTLAEIYLSQGHTAQALAIYRRLEERAPDDPSLRRRIRVLEQRLEREQREQQLTLRVERLKRLLRRVQRRRRA